MCYIKKMYLLEAVPEGRRARAQDYVVLRVSLGGVEREGISKLTQSTDRHSFPSSARAPILQSAARQSLTLASPSQEVTQGAASLGAPPQAQGEPQGRPPSQALGPAPLGC